MDSSQIAEQQPEAAPAPSRIPNVERTFRQIGGVGRFQVFAHCIITLGMISSAFWVYGLGFFLQVPDYICTFDDGTTDSCKVEVICAEDTLVTTYEVDWESDRSFQNWMVKFELTCEHEWKIALPGILYFTGLAITTTWLPSFSDINGRKFYFTLSMVVGLACHVAMLFTRFWAIIVVSSLIIGLLTPFRIQVGFNYLIELFPRKHQVAAGTTWCIIDGMCFMVTSLFFWKVSQDWFQYFLFCIFSNAICLVGLLFLPDSPRLLLDIGKEDDALEGLDQIARWNGKTLKVASTSHLGNSLSESLLHPNINEESINTTAPLADKTIDRSAEIWATLTSKEVKFNLMIMVVVWAVISFNFYLLMFLANTFEQVYQTALFLSIADCTAYFVGGVLIGKIGTKYALISVLGLAAVGGVLVLCFGLQHQDSFVFPVLFFISNFGISAGFNIVYAGNAKIFPQEISATSMGICQVLARIFSALQFFFTQMEQPIPMIIFLASSVLALVLCFFLKEHEQNDDENKNVETIETEYSVASIKSAQRVRKQK